MRNSEANPDAGLARERIAEILRAALGPPEEEALEDETRRLMLHLSIEPLANATPPFREESASDLAAVRRLLRRLLGRSESDVRA